MLDVIADGMDDNGLDCGYLAYTIGESINSRAASNVLQPYNRDALRLKESGVQGCSMLILYNLMVALGFDVVMDAMEIAFGDIQGKLKSGMTPQAYAAWLQTHNRDGSPRTRLTPKMAAEKRQKQKETKNE